MKDKMSHPHENSRRRILHNIGMAAAGAVTAKFLSGCGPGIAGQGIAINQAADAVSLNNALTAELELVGIYTGAIGLNIWGGNTITPFGNTPFSNGNFLSIANAFLAHHIKHSQDLAIQVQNRGAAPVAGFTTAQYLAANNLGTTSTMLQFLNVAVIKEKMAAYTIGNLASTFTDSTLGGLCSKLAADEGAHFAVYRTAFSMILGDTTNGGAADPLGASASTIIPGPYPSGWF